jgi:hypothetical protein
MALRLGSSVVRIFPFQNNFNNFSGQPTSQRQKRDENLWKVRGLRSMTPGPNLLIPRVLDHPTGSSERARPSVCLASYDDGEKGTPGMIRPMSHAPNRLAALHFRVRLVDTSETNQVFLLVNFFSFPLGGIPNCSGARPCIN